MDSADDPEQWVRYLAGAEEVQPMALVRERTYRALARTHGPGVDVGCGRGRAVSDLTDRGFTAIGVDASHAMISSSRLRYPRCRFVAADAARLPWPDESLSWYRAERVFLHLADPWTAAAEAARVLTPGSPIVLADQDFDTMVISSDKPGLTRQLVDTLGHAVENGHAGTRAGDYLAEAGFTRIGVSVVPVLETSLSVAFPLLIGPALDAARAAGSAGETDLREWLEEQRERDERGRFLIALSFFVTTALRP